MALPAAASVGKQPSVPPVEFGPLPGTHKCSVCFETDANNFKTHEGGQSHPVHDHCLKQSLQGRQVCPTCIRPVKMESVFKQNVVDLNEKVARDVAEIDDLKGRLRAVEGDRDSLQLLLTEQTQANQHLQAQVAQLNTQAGTDAQSIVNLTEQRNSAEFCSKMKTLALIACVAILAMQIIF